MGERARAAVQSRFTWAREAEAVVALYDELPGFGRRPARATHST